MNFINLFVFYFVFFNFLFHPLCANSIEYSGEIVDRQQFHLYIAPSLPRNAHLAFECSENASLGKINFTISFKKISLDSIRKPLDVWMLKIQTADSNFCIESSFYTHWEKGQKLYFKNGEFLPYAYFENEQPVDFSNNGFSFYVTDTKKGMRYGPILPVFKLPRSSFDVETINAWNEGCMENLNYYYIFTSTRMRLNDHQRRLNY